MAGYTWAQWRAKVISLLSDRQPDDTAFVLAAGEWVQAQASLQQFGDDKGYALHYNAYKAKRRRLLGYAFSGNDAALSTAVKTLLRDPAPTDGLFAQACAAYVKAEIAREVNRDPALYESMRRSYLERRLRLAGYQHGLGNALQAEVDKFLPVDAERLNTANYKAALTANAVADLQGFGSWIDAQIGQAKADLTGLSAKIDLEIQQAVMDLQSFIPQLCVGHVTRLGEDDVTPFGNGAIGLLPDTDMQVTEAWRVYVGDEVTADPDDEEAQADAAASQDRQRQRCHVVPWRDRHVLIAAAQDCTPRIAFSVQTQELAISPPLAAGVHEIELRWNGRRVEWEDTDLVRLDDEAAKAVSQWVNKELSVEFGDSIAVQNGFTQDYIRTRRSLYLKLRDAEEVRS